MVATSMYIDKHELNIIHVFIAYDFNILSYICSLFELIKSILLLTHSANVDYACLYKLKYLNVFTHKSLSLPKFSLKERNRAH